MTDKNNYMHHQQLLREQVLSPIKNAVIGRAIAFQDLPPSANYKKGTWQFNSQITADLGHEVQANLTLMDAGLKTYESVYGEMGLDFEEETEKMAKEVSYLHGLAQKHGIPVELLSKRLEGATQIIDGYQQQLQQQEMQAQQEQMMQQQGQQNAQGA